MEPVVMAGECSTESEGVLSDSRIRYFNPTRTLLKEFFILSNGATSIDGGPYMYGGGRLPVNYGQAVGDGLQSSVLMSPIKWILRNFPQAVLEMLDQTKAPAESIPQHPLVKLIARPNTYYAGSALWAGTILSRVIDGNAYWLKLRRSGRRPWYEDVTSEVKELWYSPHWIIEPKWPKDGSVFISHYDYKPNGSGATIAVAPENVVHFRFGIDPRNTRKGLSAIESELREIFTDDEAAAFVGTLLRNMGVPGLVLSPEGAIDAATANEVKDLLISKTTGARRGEPLVTLGPAKVQPYGFSPQQMDLSSVRNTPEERICAALGLPAAVVGFGTGLQQTKVGATMREMRRMAWEDCLIPMQGDFAEQIGIDLVPEFEATPENVKPAFNHSAVPAMQESLQEKVRGVDMAVRGGWLRVDTAQSMAGFDVDETQAIYLRSSTVVAIPAEVVPAPPAPRPQLEPADIDDEPVPKARVFPVRPKALLKETARERWLERQGALEEEVAPKIAKQFDADLKALRSALPEHMPKRAGDWIDDALDTTSAAWLKLLEESVVMRGIEVGNELLRADVAVGVDFDLIEERAALYASRRAGTAITQISETTAKAVRGIITEAIESGWSLTRTKSALADLFDGFSNQRAFAIARTETASAMNWGRYQSAKETATRLQIEIKRTWLAVNDSRTRPSHVAANGQTIGLEESYIVGGVLMKHPGDPMAPAQEVILCRCTEIMTEVKS